MVLQNNKELLTYWNKVRAGRPAPKRTEITPSAISPMLPYTFILELRNDDQLYFRLAGSKVCEMFGKEFRGINFLECWPATEQPVLTRHLGQLIREGTIVTLNGQAISESDHTGDFEIICLPLTHSGRNIDRVLGSIAPAGDYPWLGMVKLKFRHISEIHVSYLREPGMNLQSEIALKKQTFINHKRLIQAKNCQLRVYDGGKSE